MINIVENDIKILNLTIYVIAFEYTKILEIIHSIIVEFVGCR
jgi:hypothetical protein